MKTWISYIIAAMNWAMNLSCRPWSGTSFFTRYTQYWSLLSPRQMADVFIHGHATRWQHLSRYSRVNLGIILDPKKQVYQSWHTDYIWITTLWVHELMMIIIMICTGLVGANQYNLLWINNWAIRISRGGFKYIFSLRILVYWCHYRYFKSDHCKKINKKGMGMA